LETYGEIHGDLRVPTRFVVPDEDPWHKEIRGHKLGLRVSQMRQTG
ncbi:unnamed protein product, partial [Discosporangium mesarthrocarpum]